MPKFLATRLGHWFNYKLAVWSARKATRESLAQRYETIVALSLGPDGALVANDTDTIHVQNPPVDAQSAVGSGDCTLAGLAYGFTHKLPFEDALKYGVAAGTANTLVVGAGNFTLDDFERIRAEIVMTRY